jgi:hypothetical protein
MQYYFLSLSNLYEITITKKFVLFYDFPLINNTLFPFNNKLELWTYDTYNLRICIGKRSLLWKSQRRKPKRISKCVFLVHHYFKNLNAKKNKKNIKSLSFVWFSHFDYLWCKSGHPICTTPKTSSFKTSTSKTSTFSPKTSIVKKIECQKHRLDKTSSPDVAKELQWKLLNTHYHLLHKKFLLQIWVYLLI